MGVFFCPNGSFDFTLLIFATIYRPNASVG